MENVPTWEENLTNTLAYDLLYLVKMLCGYGVKKVNRD